MDDKKYILIILPLILILCFAIWYGKTGASDSVVIKSNSDITDLRNVSMSKNFVRVETYNVKYIPNELLTPDEFNTSTKIQYGTPEDNLDYLTMKFKIRVTDNKVYAIVGNSLDYAERIYVNGTLMEQVGVPGTNVSENVPQTRLIYFTVVPKNGELEIVRQTSNFVHRDGGYPGSINIGSPESAQSYYDSQFLYTSLIMGGFIFLFVVHLALFVLMRSYYANLYFALFCLVWFIRTGVTGPKVLTSLFPDSSWYLTFRLEYIAIPLACILILLALDSMFPGMVNRIIKYAVIIIQSVFVLLFIFISTITMSEILMVPQVVAVVTGIYISTKLVMALRTNRDAKHVIVFIALLIFLYTIVREIFYHNEILLPPFILHGMMDFASIVFILFLMLCNFYGTVQEIRQVQERKNELEAERMTMERINILKDNMISDISHEIRTPLTVMSSYSQMAVKNLSKEDIDPLTIHDLSIISKEAHRLSNMASDILQVFNKDGQGESKMQKSEEMVTSVMDVLNRSEKLLSTMLEKNGNTLTINAALDLPHIVIEQGEFSQIIWNILINSNKHTDHGNITVNVTIPDEENSELSKPHVRISIKDDGAGITLEVLEKIFDRGHTDGGGTGLGLSICREIVEASGGTISIDSKVGVGTEVIICIPTSN